MDIDRAVLMDIYEGCGGEDWQDKENWCSELPINKWAGVHTDEYGRVIGLRLWGNRLTGNIPESIGDLTFVKELYLNGNSLTGNLPSSMVKLLRLERFDIHYNQISGGWEYLETLTEMHTLYVDGDITEYLKLPQDMKNKPLQDKFACSRSRALDEHIAAIKDKTRDVNDINIHGDTAIIEASRLGKLSVVKNLIDQGADVNRKNTAGCSALGLALNRQFTAIVMDLIIAGAKPSHQELVKLLESKSDMDDRRVMSSLISSFNPFENDAGTFDPDAGMFWIYVISSARTQECCEGEVNNMLDKHIDKIRAFASVLDSRGRRAVDTALPKFKKAIEERMLFMRRFELKEGPSEHTSATCVLKLARDNHDGGRHVAMKFMKYKSQFLRELEARRRVGVGSEDDTRVISTLMTFDGESDPVYLREAEKKGLYPYCIVMPAADRNLSSILAHEHIAGRDWTQLKFITRQLVEDVAFMHSKGLIHGDIKPLNIMRINGRFVLIDLDGAVSFQDHEYVGAVEGSKYSSGYIPPEMIAIVGNGQPVVRSYESLQEYASKGEHDYVLASPAHDMWALGVTLFQMYTGEPLFLMNDEGNIDSFQLHLLHDWTPDFKNERLSRVSDIHARNLLSRLLNKDPANRVDVEHVLAHPFVSSSNPSRLVGEEAKYDVFLSYRIASDDVHAKILYDMLTSKGLRVFLDQKCMDPGVPWEEGFCDGIVNCRIYVCLLSKSAVHDPDKGRQNFEKLTQDSVCDNVFLEQRMALELVNMGLIDRVFPIFIGERIGDAGVYSRYGEFGDWASDVVVESVEAKLREHLDRLGLGAPLNGTSTARATLSKLGQSQGFFIENDGQKAFDAASNILVQMNNSLVNKDTFSLQLHGLKVGGGSSKHSLEDIVRLKKEYITMLDGLHRLSYLLDEFTSTMSPEKRETPVTAAHSTSVVALRKPSKNGSKQWSSSSRIHITSDGDTMDSSFDSKSLRTLLRTLQNIRRQIADTRPLMSNDLILEAAELGEGDDSSSRDAGAVCKGWVQSIVAHRSGASYSYTTEGKGRVTYISLDRLSASLMWRGPDDTGGTPSSVEGGINKHVDWIHESEAWYHVRLKKGVSTVVSGPATDSALHILLSSKESLTISVGDVIQRDVWVKDLNIALAHTKHVIY